MSVRRRQVSLIFRLRRVRPDERPRVTEAVGDDGDMSVTGGLYMGGH